MEGRSHRGSPGADPRMQEGVRHWVRRYGGIRRDDGAAGEHGRAEGRTRRLAPLALLAGLTASACSPLFTVGDGVLTLAGAGLVSAMGTGVLSGLLTSAIDRVRERSEGRWSPCHRHRNWKRSLPARSGLLTVEMTGRVNACGHCGDAA